jgi:hypothetical protein
MKNLNAYREVPIYDGRGVWRQGGTLVMDRSAVLPHRCVKCNAPARSRIRHTVWWYHPALYLLLLIFILPGFVLFILAVVFSQREETIEIPLCQEHLESRFKGIMIGWLILGPGILLCFAPFLDVRLVFLVVIGALMVVCGSIYQVIHRQVLTARKIDKTHLWLKNVCPAYLDMLPEFADLPVLISKPKPMPFDDEL